MLAIGTHEVGIMSDGWTVKTRDRSLAAHWEHTIAIQPDGAEILSLSSNWKG
jgi:methionyl aminopeptidase